MSASPNAPPAMPRWVKVSLVVGGIVLALLVVVAIANPGGHGPSMHAAGGDDEATTGGDASPTQNATTTPARRLAAPDAPARAR